MFPVTAWLEKLAHYRGIISSPCRTAATAGRLRPAWYPQWRTDAFPFFVRTRINSLLTTAALFIRGTPEASVTVTWPRRHAIGPPSSNSVAFLAQRKIQLHCFSALAWLQGGQTRFYGASASIIKSVKSVPTFCLRALQHFCSFEWWVIIQSPPDPPSN